MGNLLISQRYNPVNFQNFAVVYTDKTGRPLHVSITAFVKFTNLTPGKTSPRFKKDMTLRFSSLEQCPTDLCHLTWIFKLPRRRRMQRLRCDMNATDFSLISSYTSNSTHPVFHLEIPSLQTKLVTLNSSFLLFYFSLLLFLMVILP